MHELLELNMSMANASATESAEQLSALLDGELDASLVGQACAAWRDSGVARSTWHAYHLIGDVMRSDDLASVVQRDAAFLDSVRARLSGEAIVLAPQPEQASPVARQYANGTRSHRWSWRAPAAVTAGFVAVAGVLVVTRGPAPASVDTAAVAPAAVSSIQSPVARVAMPSAAQDIGNEPERLVANGKLIRDARLDRYIAAHKQFAGSSALGVPSTFLRSATADGASR
jgi:sigma-E factor negative regulatory protein RseA